jgi:hypothetical protein
VPTSYEAADAQLRSLLGDRPDGFVEAGGDLIITVGDRRLYLQVFMFGPDAAVVQIMAPLVAGVADSDELCEAIASADLPLGRLLLLPPESGTRSVELVVRLHADQLRADTLEHLLEAAASAAQRWDEELESRFGARWSVEGSS